MKKSCTGLSCIALLLALPAAAFCADGDAVHGKTVFARCASCHQVGPSARAGFGPQLNGLFGRPAGTTPDYAYSAALKKSGVVWSEQTLTAFLKDPGDYVPGTKMRFFGMSNEKDLADLFAYLRQFQ